MRELELFGSGAFDFSSLVVLSDLVPLVVVRFAPGNPDLHFNTAILKVHPRWNEGEPFLKSLAFQRIDLAAVHEELAISAPLGLKLRSELVGLDIAIMKEYLSGGNRAVSIGQVGAT